jgi:TRAP-type uncharacterized transport system substrate-binding protein
MSRTEMAHASSPRVSRRRRSFAIVVAALVFAVAAAAAWMLVTSKSVFPPRTLVMATGPEGSANRELGARYRAILARSGLDLRLVPSAGGVENLARLHDPRSGVNVALVEGGIVGGEETSDLVSLGTVSFEPLWLFYRGVPQGTRAQALLGKRISIGPEGSGTRALARRLLALNGMDEKSSELLGLAPDLAAEALLRGEIDAAIVLTSLQSPAVRKLLAADGITLATYPRADAYVALFPYLNKLVLPTGVADLARNIPPADVALLAVEGSLAVHKDLHPALQYLLLEAAVEVHGGPGIFNRAGRFPAPEAIDLPLSRYALEFYKSGRPYLYRNLPFWLADLANRLLILLVPLFAVVLPLARYLPMIYEFAIERRMFSLYRELKIIEMELEARPSGEATSALAAALEELARRVNRLKVPLHFTQRLFILKNHIAAAQERMERRGGTGSRAGGA